MTDPQQSTFTTEVALASVSVATLVGMTRLFRGGSFLAPLLVVIVVGHGAAALCRRRRVPAPLTALVSVGLGAVVIGLVQYGSTTVLGLPGRETLRSARVDLQAAWDAFGSVVAPTPVIPGFVVASAVGFWAVAWLADTAAFRLRATFEALLPAGVLFVFATMLGRDQYRILSATLFAASSLAFLLLQRAGHEERSGTWVGGGQRTGRRAALGVGAVLAAMAVMAGAVVGPGLPGARSDAVVDWRDGDNGPGARVTVSPLVDIRSRLVDQSDTVAFRVRSNQRSYWRLTALDQFDGSVWSSSGSFREADGSLPGLDADAADVVSQDFRIDTLSTIWLPSAFQPTSVRTDGTRVRFDQESSTLIVDRDSESSNGVRYQVQSLIPSFDVEELDRVDSGLPASIQQRYLALPAAFPAEVRELARQLTFTAGNPYEQARRLQDFFRQNFIYDLSVQSGHGDDAITEFLRLRRGYCEQFAGTFAAMARSVGLPARVAVGFTPGDPDPDDPDRYIVRGRHAHAWPEVWINQVGWVPFEPTPGRGAPGAEGWTGAAEAQDGAGVPASSTTTTSTTVPVGPGGSSPTTQPDFNRLDSVGQSGRPAGSKGSSPVMQGLWLLVGAVVLAACWAGSVALLRAARRQRRRRLAHTVVDRVRLAWVEGTEWLGVLAPPHRPSETYREYAWRVRGLVGPAATPATELARLATLAEWSGRPLTPEVADRADELQQEIERQVREQMERQGRWRRWFDPRVGGR